MRKLLLLSSSTVHGSAWLEYCREYIIEFFTKNGVKEIVFVPYASADDLQKYTDKVRTEFTSWGKGFTVVGLNEVPNPIEAVEKAQGIFIGGGNTFLLLKELQDKNLMDPIRRQVLEKGAPYMGISAGTNVSTIGINVTNDMPIVWPRCLRSLGLVDFHINPHYMDTDPDSTHKGETREMRLQEYHSLKQPLPPVLGLREGSYLHVQGDVATLGGIKPSRLFVQGKEPVEYPCGSDVSFLLKQC